MGLRDVRGREADSGREGNSKGQEKRNDAFG